MTDLLSVMLHTSVTDQLPAVMLHTPACMGYGTLTPNDPTRTEPFTIGHCYHYRTYEALGIPSVWNTQVLHLKRIASMLHMQQWHKRVAPTAHRQLTAAVSSAADATPCTTCPMVSYRSLHVTAGLASISIGILATSQACLQRMTEMTSYLLWLFQSLCVHCHQSGHGRR